MKPLVSILIPAYNAEKTIADSIESALAQTWPRKEIIVVDDGSTDSTANVIRRFGSRAKLVSSENRGLSAAVNLAIRHSQGDYIQELDSDDLLAPDKIERQLATLRPEDSKRLLLSSSWARFYYRTRHAKFLNNSLCQDLSPVEWMLRKLNENLHMQNATWLVSRELVDTAGPWNEALNYDQDGEYFARVLLASEGVRFVSGTGIYYRAATWNSISYIGGSDRKRVSLLLSMRLHIRYLRSLEDSERVRAACLTYLQNWYGAFYPARLDLAEEVQSLAAELGGRLEVPKLRPKYAWMKPIFGSNAAHWTERTLPQFRASCISHCDHAMHWLEGRKSISSSPRESRMPQGN